MNDFPMISKCQIDSKNIEVTLLNAFEHENYPNKQYIIYSISEDIMDVAAVNIGILLEVENGFKIDGIKDENEKIELNKLLDEYLEILRGGE